MKQILAIVKPYLVEKVIQSIVGQQVNEISIREVKGYGRQKNYLEGYRENEYSLAFVPKVEISVWCEDDLLDDLVDLMVAASRTGRPGDGKILIVPVVECRSVI